MAAAGCGEKGLEMMGFSEHGERALIWARAFMFVTISTLVFAVLFEWDRYLMAAGSRVYGLSLTDNALLLWLLVAKSLGILIPVLIVTRLLIQVGFLRAANVSYVGASILIFYYMAVDLVSVGFAGYHIWGYLPHLTDILAYPGQHIWQWAGDGLLTEAVLLLGIFFLSGMVVFGFVSQLVTRLPLWARRMLCSRRCLLGQNVALLLVILTLIPALDYFRDQYLLARIFTFLPLPADMRNALHIAREEAAAQLRPPRRGALAANVAGMARHGTRLEFEEVPHGSESLGHQVDVFGFTFSLPPTAFLEGKLSVGHGNVTPTSPLGGRERQPCSHYAPNEEDQQKGPFKTTENAHSSNPDFFEAPENMSSDEYEAELLAHRIVEDAANPKPVDRGIRTARPELPHVLLIIMESLRPEALSPKIMGKLDAWSTQGLRLLRHYSGSNCSHLGMFSLLYGRAPLGYHETLDRGIPPQLLETVKDLGYQVSLVTSGEIKGFRRLHDFVNERTCDAVIFEGNSPVQGMDEWPQSDRRKLHRARTILKDAGGKPQFVFFYLLSTHHRYAFPPEFEIFQESASFWRFLYPREQIRNYQSRYTNACLFLEHELMKLVKSIDMNRTIIVITGDHGESMGEDGVFTHGTRMSEVQVRTPLAMVGPGVPAKTIRTATVHMDVLPTLLHAILLESTPVAGCDGRDLIAKEFPHDRVVVVPAVGRDFDRFLIIQGEQRSLYKANLNQRRSGGVEHLGLLDEAGHFLMKFSRAE